MREIIPGPDGLSDGTIITVAGNEKAGYSGDGELAVDASLNDPTGLAVDAQGDLFIADTGNGVVREVAANGIITTVAGPAGLSYPTGVAVESVNGQRYLFVANLNQSDVVQVSPTGTYVPLAGTETNEGPSGVALDSQGDLFVANAPWDLFELTPGSDGLPSVPTAIVPQEGSSIASGVAMQRQWRRVRRQQPWWLPSWRGDPRPGRPARGCRHRDRRRQRL